MMVRELHFYYFYIIAIHHMVQVPQAKMQMNAQQCTLIKEIHIGCTLHEKKPQATSSDCFFIVIKSRQ